MAYIFDNKEEDDELQQTGGQQLGPESAVIPAGGQPEEQKGGPTSSGQYVNLQSYLTANAPRKFGEEVAGKVGERVTEAENTLSSAESQFKADADKGSIDKDEELVNRAASAPESVYQSQPERERFTAQRTAQYQGPSQFLDTQYGQDAQSKVRSAQEEATAAQSEGGLKGVLQNYYGSQGTYSPGQQNLDLLLAQGGGTKPMLEEAGRRGTLASDRFSNLQQTLGDYAKNRQNATQEAQRYALETVGGARDAQQKAMNDKFQAIVGEQGTRTKAIADEKARLAQGQLSAKEAQESGLTGDLSIYGGMDPSKFMDISRDPNIHEVTSKEDLSRYQALSDLLGQENTAFTFGDLAGTYDPTKDVSFRAQDFAKEQSDKQKIYQALLDKQVFRDPGRAMNERPVMSVQELAEAYGLGPAEIAKLTPILNQGRVSGLQALKTSPTGFGSIAEQQASRDDYLNAMANMSPTSRQATKENYDKFVALEKLLNEKYGANKKLSLV